MAEQLYFPLYLRDWEGIRGAVSAEQGWNLVLRCLDYCQGRELPPEDDPVVRALFALLSSSIDRNMEAVADKQTKARYSRYCLQCKNEGSTPLNYDRWLSDVDSRRRSSTTVNDRQRSSETSTIQSNRNLIEIEINNPLRVDDAPSSETSSKYVPQYWERDIPRVYWGQFLNEDEFYSYVEAHRDEVSAAADKENLK